ncbi:MAG: efflux RND transporter periplasmic adaptor subunit [Alphaproteobacteria bacterium]|nr:MAG: efflux RND transporter periplasmic adaptor subunit [Alphaproteobacteria bacterium]
MRHAWHRPVAAFATACAIASLLGGCSAVPAAPAGVPPLVETMVMPIANPADGNTGASYTGVVRSRIETDLSFRADGKIVQRLVDPGQTVSRGQLLMRLDPVDLGLSAEAAAQRRRAAEADAARTAADTARLEGLVEAGAISAAAFDAAVSAQRVAAANLAAARAAAREAGNRQGYGGLAADSDGVVIDVLAQPGQVVAAGTPVLRLARAGAREALIAVPETALADLPRQATARLYGSDTSAPARLREVAGAADPLTRTYAARYVLDGAGATAPLGATVSISVRAAGQGGAVLPQGALHEVGAGPGVWVVGRGGRVTFRRVRILALADETITVAPGSLRPGERIVVLGAQMLREGDVVRIAASAAGKRA